MRYKHWLFQIPIILAFTYLFWVDNQASQGTLSKEQVESATHKVTRRISGAFTDLKFKIRGPQQPKNKIVIVEIDSNSIDIVGRWPWHRDATSLLIEKTFEAGAKLVGLDMVFSEDDRRVPVEIMTTLDRMGKGEWAFQFETDPVLGKTIVNHSRNLVLAWTSDSTCQPLYHDAKECPPPGTKDLAPLPEKFQKFAYTDFNVEGNFEFSRSPIVAAPTLVPNTSEYNALSRHQGYFNAFPDADGVIRRTSLLMLVGDRAYPSLPLEMARIALGDDLSVTLGPDMRVKRLGFLKSGRTIPVTKLGTMDINFRGPGYTFTYVSALDVLSDSDVLEDPVNHRLTGQSKASVFKDAYVLIGVSALGVFDMRAFPFDSTTPGVEGHATILDNLLSGDTMIPGSVGNAPVILLAMMLLGGAVFGYLMQRLESVPALSFFIALLGGLGFVDIFVLFKNSYNWNTVFLLGEYLTLFVVTVSVKYIAEERNKKFVRGAFAKYVSPVVVDSIMKDPKKLALGGEKRDLTILFSDIRSFTTFSERMDAKQLANFLHDYLGIMTDIVVENQGTLDKYIGDAIMAFWGAPLDQPDHAARACRAAQMMLKALAENQARWKRDFGIDVNIGIGVNSGIVSVGNMGSNTNFAYTVIGDHVNLASRLEGLTKHYGCGALTTRFTLEHIEGSGSHLPPHRVVDQVKVKGKANAVELVQIMDTPLEEEVIALFGEARAHYIAQRWSQAIEKFHVVNQKLGGNDGPSQVYIERCREFLVRAPEAGWDGAWKMESK